MRDRAVSTVNVVLNTLRVMVKKAMEWEVTPQREVKITRLAQPEPEDVEFFQPDAVRKMIEVAQGISPDAAACLLLAVDAGMRRSEFLALQWQFVDFEREVVTIALRDYRGELGPTTRATSDTNKAIEVAIRRACHVIESTAHLGPDLRGLADYLREKVHVYGPPRERVTRAGVEREAYDFELAVGARTISGSTSPLRRHELDLRCPAGGAMGRGEKTADMDPRIRPRTGAPVNRGDLPPSSPPPCSPSPTFRILYLTIRRSIQGSTALRFGLAARLP